MAEVMARLYLLPGEPAWRSRTEALLRACSGDRQALSAMPGVLAAADFLEEAACVVIAGPPEDPQWPVWIATALASPDPAIAVLRVTGAETLAPTHPAYGRPVGDTAVAYLCRQSVCSLPVDDPVNLQRMVRARLPGTAG